MVPHADDDLLGGYALHLLQGEKLLYGYFGLTGSNNDPANKKDRDREFNEYIRYINSHSCELHNSEEITRVIQEHNIKTIYLPSIVDWHPEHRLLNYLLLDCLQDNYESKVFDSVNLVWYSVSVPICDNEIWIAPMSKKEQKEKYQLFKTIYKSQSHMPVERFLYQERINALGTQIFAGECFSGIELNDWERIVDSIRKIEINNGEVTYLNELKQYIDSINIIRDKGTQIYKSMKVGLSYNGKGNE